MNFTSPYGKSHNKKENHLKIILELLISLMKKVHRELIKHPNMLHKSKPLKKVKERKT